MNKTLIAVAAASSLCFLGSVARADGPGTPTSPPASMPAPTTTAAPAAAPASAATEEAPAPVAKRSVLPMVTIITGGAAFLVGLGCLSYASTKESQANTYDRVDESLASSGSSTTGYGKKERDGVAGLRTTGTVLAAGGAAVAAGGLVWFFIDGQRVKNAKAATSASLHVAPAVGPTTAGAYLQGTF